MDTLTWVWPFGESRREGVCAAHLESDVERIFRDAGGGRRTRTES